MLLLLAAVQAAGSAALPADAVAAERAFAADAATLGTWAAFRKWAAPNATMFDPQPVNPTTLLRDRAELPRPIRWSPAASYVSCNGAVAANTGPWTHGRERGYFTTVWAHSGDGWRWLVDGGDTLRVPRPAVSRPAVRKASCRGTAPGPTISVAGDEKVGQGAARDNTLQWRWTVQPRGKRRFTVTLWNGSAFDTVIDDIIAAPSPRSLGATLDGTSPAGLGPSTGDGPA